MEIEPLPAERQTFVQLGQLRGGLKVSHIVNDSAAAEAGVRAGDVVVGFGEYETDTLGNLAYAIMHAGPRGSRVLLRREGTTYSTLLPPHEH
jgi:S1-C subfamily serine protease